MNGHDFTREQNMEARIRLAAARRELADAVNDATSKKYFLDVDGKVIGWGSIPGAIRWLRDLRDYCARHPDYKIIVF